MERNDTILSHVIECDDFFIYKRPMRCDETKNFLLRIPYGEMEWLFVLWDLFSFHETIQALSVRMYLYKYFIGKLDSRIYYILINELALLNQVTGGPELTKGSVFFQYLWQFLSFWPSFFWKISNSILYKTSCFYYLK